MSKTIRNTFNFLKIRIFDSKVAQLAPHAMCCQHKKYHCMYIKNIFILIISFNSLLINSMYNAPAGEISKKSYSMRFVNNVLSEHFIFQIIQLMLENKKSLISIWLPRNSKILLVFGENFSKIILSTCSFK